METNNHSNPPGLPAWPSVDVTPRGVTVFGTIEDPDVFDDRKNRVSLALKPIIIVVVALIGCSEAAYRPEFSKTILRMGYPVYQFNNVTATIICVGLWFWALNIFMYSKRIGGKVSLALLIWSCVLIFGDGFWLITFGFWGLGAFVISLFIASFIAFLFVGLSPWGKSSIRLEFTNEAIDTLNAQGKVRRFSLADVDEIQFHAAPHPRRQAAARNHNSSDFLDACTVNLVYGLEEVRLLSTGDEQSARDFVACCNWALKRARGRFSPGAPSGQKPAEKPTPNLE